MYLQSNIRSNATFSFNHAKQARRPAPAPVLSPSELRRIVAEMLG